MAIALIDSHQARQNAADTFPTLHYHPCQRSRSTFIWQSLVATLAWRPTIVLTGHPHFAPLCWVLARLSRARFLSSMHGVEVWSPLPPIRRWALQQADQLISVSQFTAQQAAASNGVALAKVQVLYHCLDPQFTNAVPQSLSVSSQPSLLTVARIDLAEQYKGQDYVIRAMPQLLKRFPNLVYHIIGDGDGRSWLETLAVQEGVAHAVQFHGFVSEDVLRAYYAQASLYIMPSRGEGFGFVFLEAMAYGTPVIGGTVDATPEVVVDGQTGYLVNPTSVTEIVEAATRLLADTPLRERMGAAARQHVAQTFSLQKFQQQLLQIIQACDGPSTEYRP